MSANTILFATSNKGKIAWLERALKAKGLHDWAVEKLTVDLLEIQSDDIAEISRYKAEQAFAMVKQPVLVMDGGFYIDELNGFPGPFARYMFDQMGVYALAKLAGTLDNPTCHFKNVATYIDASGVQQFFDTTGKIFKLGTEVWPHDHPEQWSSAWRILIPAGLGYTKPLAAMGDAELQAYISKRAQSDEDNSCLSLAADYIRQNAADTRRYGT